MARIAQAAASDEDAGLDAALYVLHELAHLPQGIGDYAVVQRLRAIDEGLVLDMDLAADHFAALVVAQMGWAELARLKDRQGRGLCNYPVGPDHAPAARLRKARRVVSLRADCLLRQRGLLASGAGYVSAAFGSERGLAVVEMGRGVSTLLACAELSPRAQAVLLGAADRAADVRAATARLDAVLYRLLPQLRRAA
ncbi:MAG: hypothetical protein KC613_07070 [Myxococcales bacterium]|nr:hypothetical protein [Myxococcales bacterium]